MKYNEEVLEGIAKKDPSFAQALEAIRAKAWDQGYAAGGLDGYFETHEEKNPYKDNV